MHKVYDSLNLSVGTPHVLRSDPLLRDNGLRGVWTAGVAVSTRRPRIDACDGDAAGIRMRQTMELSFEHLNGIELIKLVGDLDGHTAPQVQADLLPRVAPGSKSLLDMSSVQYMSSAGLRLLLVLYRQLKAKEGRVILLGLGDDIKDTMSVTGFLDFFDIADHHDDAVQRLQ